VTERTHAPDYVLLATVGALTALGLVMVYSASFVEGYTLQGNQHYYVFRQFIGTVIGVSAMLVIQRIDYRVWRTYSVHIMALALLLLFLVLILPTSMTEVNGSRSWIRFGSGMLGLFSIQPAELAKLALIIYFASWLSRRSAKVGNVTYGLVPFAVMLGLVCGLIMLQPDLGTTVVIVLIGGVIYFAAGANLWHIFGAAGLGAAAFWMLINVIGWRNYRIEAFRDPWQYSDSFGYQPIHALFALGSGGIFGTGLGQGRQKFQWLPQAHTDTIFAIIGEELGLIGTVTVLLAFTVIAYRGYRIAGRAPNPFAALVAVGITSWITLQALMNIAVTTSLIPFTGLTLPFLSYGSTSLIMSLVSVGILLNISRHAHSHAAAEITDAPSIRRAPALAFAPVAGLRRGNWRARLSGLGGRKRYQRR
jgi:cell division protein FtsW